MNKPFSGKKILLAAPVNYGIYKMLIQQLIRLGFEVVDFSVITEDFRYKNSWQRLHNLLRKSLFNDRENKQRLRQMQLNSRVEEAKQRLEKLDYALFIRPDMFPMSIVEAVKENVDVLVAYQWDGLSRYPEVEQYIDKFDRFFVFDPFDVDDNKLPITNFYAEDDSYQQKKSLHSKAKAFFIGHYSADRFQHTLLLKKILNRLSIDCQFMVSANTTEEKKIVKASSCSYISKQLSYLDALQLVKKSDILIDLNISAHIGLSFRCFEALNYQKKLITTNKSIENYDFYDENNIYIWNRLDEVGLADFLSKPYRPVSSEIRRKYGFENWIKYVLNQGEYQPINLPNCKHEQT